MSKLLVKGLHVSIEGKEILKGVDLSVRSGEVHAIMGPNGGGKSTLASALMGHPKYAITSGDVTLDGKSILALDASKRARAGIFLAFQYPQEVQGVSLESFLRMAYNAVHAKQISPLEFRPILEGKMALLGIDGAFAGRYLNDGFSGGEKKRAEILQMAVLEPKIAILDETDSGLDVTALQKVGEGICRIASETGAGCVIITHYERILRYVKPGFTHVMLGGRIVKSGGFELVSQIEKRGYDWLKQAQAPEERTSG
ncbi:Fe-S cluster assembly ATPase SufC [Candidatus Micrarchaeota archaeon]|nr:Fe-S cluster assembly ATPase SufC [Candidatus Micrarchaeota archaeon]